MNWKKFRRKACRFIRRHRHHLLLVCIVVIGAAVLLMSNTVNDYDDFLDALGMRESSDDYTKVNRYRYLGRYQMGRSALEDAGFRDEDGAWTSLANSYGIYSEDDYLHSPAGQDAAVTAYHEKLCGYIRAYGLDEYIGETYCGVEVTQSGLLAACHLVGITGLRRGLVNGQHVYDGNHTPAAEYMELFAGYDISAVWNDQ